MKTDSTETTRALDTLSDCSPSCRPARPILLNMFIIVLMRRCAGECPRCAPPSKPPNRSDCARFCAAQARPSRHGRFPGRPGGAAPFCAQRPRWLCRVLRLVALKPGGRRRALGQLLHRWALRAVQPQSSRAPRRCPQGPSRRKGPRQDHARGEEHADAVLPSGSRTTCIDVSSSIDSSRRRWSSRSGRSDGTGG